MLPSSEEAVGEPLLCHPDPGGGGDDDGRGDDTFDVEADALSIDAKSLDRKPSARNASMDASYYEGSATMSFPCIARLTTFGLVHDAVGGFDAVAEKVDRIFKNDILTVSHHMRGYIDCRRMLDTDSGECIIVSFWETEEDADASLKNDSYYAGGQKKLWPFVRHNMFKTETFRVDALGNGAESKMSPYVLLTRIVVTEDAEEFQVAKLFYAYANAASGTANGFVGAYSFQGISNQATNVRMLVTHWDSAGTLKAATSRVSNERRVLHEELIETARSLPQVAAVSSCSFSNFNTLSSQSTRSGRLCGFREGSASTAVFQLACISLGVGIFVMPGVFATLGLGLGTVMVVGWGIAADLAMQCLLMMASARSVGSYEDCCAGTFGAAGRVTSLLSLFVACLTANCAHFQFIASSFLQLDNGTSDGGFVRKIVGTSPTAQTIFVMSLFGLCALPLCFKRRLGSLRHVSLGVLFFCCTAAVVVCGKLVSRMVSTGNLHNVAFVHDVSAATFLDQVPIAAFGYSMVAELFSVRSEAMDPRKLPRSVHIAMAIIVTIYTTVGIIGALAFEKPGANVLENFHDDNVINILVLGLCIMITLLYPLINWPTVNAVDALIAGPGGVSSHTRKKRISVACLCLIILLDNLLGRSIGTVFGLAGSIGLGLIAFVLPVLTFLVDALGRNVSLQMKRRKMWIGATAIILLAGAGMTIGSTARILYAAIRTQ